MLLFVLIDLASHPIILPTKHWEKIPIFGERSSTSSRIEITYTLHFSYFDFHLAPSAPNIHGVIPVWGFGTIVASNISKVHVNERVFGYLGMARYLLLPLDELDINEFNIYVPRPHLPRGTSVEIIHLLKFTFVLRSSTI